MSQHPSLKSSSVGSKFRAVLKRFEKLKTLVEKEEWTEEKNSVYKMPKIRRLKFKAKKAPKVPAKEEAADAKATATSSKTEKKTK